MGVKLHRGFESRPLRFVLHEIVARNLYASRIGTTTIIELAMTASSSFCKWPLAGVSATPRSRLKAVQREHAGDSTGEWGDMSTLHEAALGETMQRLAEDERAAGHERLSVPAAMRFSISS